MPETEYVNFTVKINTIGEPFFRELQSPEFEKRIIATVERGLKARQERSLNSMAGQINCNFCLNTLQKQRTDEIMELALKILKKFIDG